MHLRLVAGESRRTFDLSKADFDVPIPAYALEDVPTLETPTGLEDLRTRLSDWETDPTAEENFWCVAFTDLIPATAQNVVPLVTEHYVRDRVCRVFAQWQAARETRCDFALSLRIGRTRGPSLQASGIAAALVRLARTDGGH